VTHYPGRRHDPNTTNVRRVDLHTGSGEDPDMSILHVSMASNDGAFILTRRHRSQYQRSTGYGRYIRPVRSRVHGISGAIYTGKELAKSRAIVTRLHGEVWERKVKERPFWVANGPIFIALPPAFQLNSLQGPLYIVRGQQNWPSNFGGLFTIDLWRHSNIGSLTIGTVSTRTKTLQDALTICFDMLYVH